MSHSTNNAPHPPFSAILKTNWRDEGSPGSYKGGSGTAMVLISSPLDKPNCPLPSPIPRILPYSQWLVSPHRNHPRHTSVSLFGCHFYCATQLSLYSDLPLMQQETLQFQACPPPYGNSRLPNQEVCPSLTSRFPVANDISAAVSGVPTAIAHTLDVRSPTSMSISRRCM